MMRALFQETERPYRSRYDHTFRIYHVKTVQYETKTLPFVGPKIWSLVSSNIKTSEALEIFNQNIRYWKPDNCP